MENGNPTAGDGGATTADPIDRIQALLDAEGGDEQQHNGGDADAANASKTPDKPEEGDQGKTEEPQFTTAHLAQFLGIEESEIDVDADGQPVFKTKINGKEGSAKFKDFLADYQKQGSADNRLREASDREKAADRKLQEAEQAVTAKLTEQQEALKQVAGLAILMNQDLLAERNSINWDALWEQNPGQARALERRFDERQTKINGAMMQLRQRDGQIRQQAEAKQKELEEKNHQAQGKRLLELIPEWKDSAVFAKERAELIAWVDKTGVDTSDLDLNKASQVALIRRAWQHDTLQSSKPEIENKLRTAPKLVKPGTPTNTNAQEATVKGLKADFKKSGDTKTLTQLLIAKGLA